jgi:lipooligosaccharide transport system ATP-binding protein
MQNTPVISARGLVKRYKDLVAVNGIDFDILPGECFGFLGPNGAGKTTTMKMISCMSPPTGGQLMVNGMDVMRQHREIKTTLGIVSQADTLDPNLNVYQNLYAYSRYFNIPKPEAKDRIADVLELVQLSHKAKSTPDELSGGMRRRLLIARALLNKPSILVLDEPTTGLDPQSRHLVWDKLILLRSQGITILLTTHYMEEASYLCDRLVVVDKGEILVEGKPRTLIREHAGEQVLEIQSRFEEKAAIFEMLAQTGLQYEDTGNSISIYSTNGTSSDAEAMLSGYDLFWRPANLEDVFLRLTGRGLRSDS